MASIDGLGSGLDTSTIISQLMSIEKLPQQRLVAQRQTVLSRGTAWGQIETSLTSLKSALDRVKTGGVSATTTTSSDVSRATVSGTATTAGVHSLQITALATAQRVTSGALGSSATLAAAGTLTMTKGATAIGAASASADGLATGSYQLVVTDAGSGSLRVSVNGGTAVTVNATDASFVVDGITVTRGTDPFTAGTATVSVATTAAGATLSTVAEEVTRANGSLSAVAISDGAATDPKTRLVLSGTQTGTAARVVVVSSYTDAALSQATLDRAPDATDPAGRRDAADAQLVFDDLSITRSGNSVTDLVPGITINLVSAGTTTISATADSAASVANGKAAVDALNSVLRQIASSTKYDVAAKRGGALTGDGGAQALSRRLTDAVSSAAQSATGGVTLGGAAASGTSTFTTPNLGISLQRDGTYAFDGAAFERALKEKPTEAKAFVESIAAGLLGVVSDATSTSGVVATSKKGSSERAATLQGQVDAWDGRLTLIENRLRRQFTALDTALNSLKSQGSWLSSQIAGLPSFNRN